MNAADMTSEARWWPRLGWALGGLLLLYFLLPLAALLVQPLMQPSPGRLAQLFGQPGLGRAAVVSLAAAVVATGVSLVLGVPLAHRLARAVGWRRRAGMLLAALPLLVPPVVSGLALLAVFGEGGRSFAAVVAAQVFVAAPFVVFPAQAAFEGVRPTYAQAARTLGTGRWATFRRVTLPLAAPGLAAGAALCFARAIGEFGATLVVASAPASAPRTLPVQAWVAFEAGGLAQAVLVAVLLLVVVLAVLLVLNVLAAAWRR